MLSQNFFEVNFAQRVTVPQRIGDSKCKITNENFQRKCPYKACNKAGCLISLTSIVGLGTLMVCGVMLLVALILDMRRIMWIRILTSTGLGGFVVILSVLKMHFALLASERDPSASTSQTIILSDASMLEVFTLLGAVLHFFGDIAVFTYYNLRYLQPTLFYTGQVEHI
ncbi:uncharacterized protein LOC134750370 [Cydia strobilella]|uniref:uncharacterized protein LOC134750370 n=1 Tax=Cydia strobilella TaxID=1100964 RepID=UPI00300751E1